MKKIIYIKDGGHYSHDIFFTYIEHEIFPVKINNELKNPKILIKKFPVIVKNLRRIKRSDVLIFEDAKIKKFLEFINPNLTKNKINISIVASPIIFYLIKKIRIHFYHKISHFLFLKSLKELDYVFCVSHMVKDYIKLILRKHENTIFVVYPSPPEENIKFFSSIKPDLKSSDILFLGTIIPELFKRNLDYKGVGILIKAMELLKEERISTKLYIVGRTSIDIIRKYKKDPNIRFLGYLSKGSLRRYVEKASLYVHPALFDPFSISTIEAMYAGLPTIVSKNTGAKEIVEKVRKDFIVDLDPEKIANKIIEYFNLSYSEKKELSELFREKAKEINPERSARKFKEKIEEILKR